MPENGLAEKIKFIHSEYETSDKMVTLHFMRLFLYVNEEALTDILTEQRIRISCPWKTNDATEAVAKHEILRSKEVNEMGYICFSAVHDSPAMWGHYANRARGACLVFDFNVVPHHVRQYEILKNGMSRTTPRWIQEIQYTDERASAHKINPWNNENEPNFDLLTTKSKDWEREKEYRAFYFLSHIHPENIEIPKERSLSDINYYDREILNNLSGIILGVNSEISPHVIMALLNDIKTRHKKSKEKFPLYIPADDIKVIKAKYHECKFDYEINLDEISPRKEILINRFYTKLKKASWKKHFIHSFIDLLIQEIEPAFVDHKNSFITSINAFEEKEEFIITPICDINHKHNGRYALFEHKEKRDDSYRYIRNMDNRFLKELYETAKNQNK